MGMVHAVFENGVFRPRTPVQLLEGCEVEFDPHIINGIDGAEDTLAEIYETLSRHFESGEHDVAERHNEHQQEVKEVLRSPGEDLPGKRMKLGQTEAGRYLQVI